MNLQQLKETKKQIIKTLKFYEIRLMIKELAKAGDIEIYNENVNKLLSVSTLINELTKSTDKVIIKWKVIK